MRIPIKKQILGCLVGEHGFWVWLAVWLPIWVIVFGVARFVARIF